MKKLFFILVISIVLLACASVSAEGTVPDPGMSAVLESHAYYGIGYDIPEGNYYLSCIYGEDPEWFDICSITIMTYDYFLYDESSQTIYVDLTEEDGTYSPLRIFLKSGTVLENMGVPLKITAAEPVTFE